MDIQTQIDNLTRKVDYLARRIDDLKFYQDADNQGMRQGINNVTPSTFTKQAYIDDTQVVFTNVPDGNMIVYFDKPYTVTKEGNNVLIGFEALKEATTITISIL